ARPSLLGLLIVLVVVGRAGADESRETFFELKIRKFLARECLPCQGGKKTSSVEKVKSREALVNRPPMNWCQLAIVKSAVRGALAGKAVNMQPSKKASESSLQTMVFPGTSLRSRCTDLGTEGTRGAPPRSHRPIQVRRTKAS